MIEQSFIFQFRISKNHVMYEALIVALELTRDLGARSLECLTDSQLVIRHMNGNFQVKHDQLYQYFHKAKQLKKQFKMVEVKHIPREENARANVLSKLVSGKEKGKIM